MADDDKTRTEKIAAARKRVDEMKKKKKKGSKKAGSSSKDEEKDTTAQATPEAEAVEETPKEEEDVDDSAPAATSETPADGEGADEVPTSPSQTQQPSLAMQSKMRSASFRQGSISTGSGNGSGSGPFSPGLGGDGETASDIYRKHVARIEELESENKRMAKDAADAEKRWQKAEEELADLREEDGDGSGGKKVGSESQVEKLKSEVAALERQNSQLQQQVSRAGGATRHGSSPSISAGGSGGGGATTPAVAELEAQLASKSSTIETMELEISKLRRAQVDATSSSSEREQIAALEERVARSEKSSSQAQQELTDLRRNLDRTAEKAVREGSERTSAETKVRALEHELADAVAAQLDAEKKGDGLDKKVATLTTLHKEHDSRTQALRKDKERAEKEVRVLKNKIESLEAETTKLRSTRRKSTEAAAGGGGMDDDGVDELENEERLRLERKVRDLEAEVHGLRRGVWQEKRRELSSGGGHHDVTSPGGGGGGFQDVDLGSAASPLGGKHSHHHHQPGAAGFGDLFQSGFNALTGQSATAHGGAADDDDGFLSDGDGDFDGEAFRRAQEEEALKRVERVRELKRGLSNWQGWRLDLVDIRRSASEGLGDVFEV